MLLHKTDELINGNAPVFAAGNAISAQSARIEPFAHGARGDIADFGDFAGGENVFYLAAHDHFLLFGTPGTTRLFVPPLQPLRPLLLTPGESVYAANISSIRLRALLRLRSFCRPRRQ
jgi:hypothetical protein